MSWVNSYWDAIEELYWEPSLLGLSSVPKKSQSVGEDRVSIPKTSLRPGGSIYTRPGKAAVNLARLKRLEVPLNHIFDICFSLAPSSVIEAIFLTPVGKNDGAKFVRLGREIADRYPGFGDNTGTQQDGFFVTPNTLLAIELKTGAKTSRAQLLKYVSLMMAEERLSGKRATLLLTYITPEAEPDASFAQCGLKKTGHVPDNFLSTMPASRMPRIASKARAMDDNHLQDCLARLGVHHLSWRRLALACDEIAVEARLQGGLAQTLAELMTGMAEAIRSNPGTVAPADQAPVRAEAP